MAATGHRLFLLVLPLIFFPFWKEIFSNFILNIHLFKSYSLFLLSKVQKIPQQPHQQVKTKQNKEFFLNPALECFKN